jgi:hypothetical protein
MPIPLESAQNHHPVELTRNASPETPLMQGDFTLDELREKFGTPEMTEEMILAAAGNLGHAFFKVGSVYRSFAPLKGDTAIVSPSQDSGVAIGVPANIDINAEEEGESDIPDADRFDYLVQDENETNDDNLLEEPDEEENDELDF